VNTLTYWQQKIVLVTGGSSGLGRILAEAFAEAGAKVAIVGLEPTDVERVTSEIAEQYRAETIPLVADITKQADVERIVETAITRFGKLDVLVNSAGRSMRGKLMDTTPEQFQSLFDLNVLGTIRCTRECVPHLLKEHGHVINIGSLASKSASRWTGAYPVSKHAVAAFSQQLRLELGPEGLHVLLVCPGPIQRDDPRLYQLEGVGGIPQAALAPGAGVRVRKTDPKWLAKQILTCCEKRKPELVVPWKARILFAVSQLFPSFGDWLVLKNT